MQVIYSISNKITGKRYIGSAVNFRNRKNQHLHHLRAKTHHSRYLQNAWNRYGEENFIFLILEEVANVNDLINREQWYLDNTNCEYNMCRIAGSSLGIKRSEETKKRVGEAFLGKKLSKEHCDKISQALSGRIFSEEHCRNLAIMNEKNYKPILQYTKDGEFIREWKSITEAIKSFTPFAYSINVNLSGRCKSAKGFIWKYKL